MLTLGNFDGDIDDVHVRSSLPAAVTNFNANVIAQGLTADYHEGSGFEQLRFTRIDSNIDFDWGNGSPAPELSPDGFSVRWRGCMIPEFSGTYTLYTTTDDGVRVLINDVLIIDNWNGSGAATGTVSLQANSPAMVVVEYFDATGNASARLEWSSAQQPREIIPAANFTVNETSVIENTLANYPGSWGAWINGPRSNGFADTTPDSNADGDFLVDLLEYALGTSPSTGIAGATSNRWRYRPREGRTSREYHRDLPQTVRHW